MTCKRTKPFAIEYRYHHEWFCNARRWFTWGCYTTEARRDQALKTLQRRALALGEFRAVS